MAIPRCKINMGQYTRCNKPASHYALAHYKTHGGEAQVETTFCAFHARHLLEVLASGQFRATVRGFHGFEVSKVWPITHWFGR